MPPAAHDKVANAAHHAFVTGFNTIARVSVAVAAAGAVAGYALVRSRDFVGAGGPAPAPPEPARVYGGAGFGMYCNALGCRATASTVKREPGRPPST